MSDIKARHGLSLVELVIGIAIIAIVISGSYLVINSLSKGLSAVSMDSKADQALRNTAEKIRYTAAYSFDTLDSYARPDGELVQSILVRSTIGAIDAASRTRPVNLTAEWIEGIVQKSKKMNFSVTPVRVKLSGAWVKVRVVNRGTNDGVSGVLMTTRGEDSPTVTCVTGANGDCTLAGVRLSETGEMLNVDGTLVRHYFAADADHPKASFFRSFQLPRTDVGKLTDFSVPPIEIDPPGTITGLVKDTTNNQPVSGAQIYLYKDPGTLVIDATISGSDKIQVTNSQGVYTFVNVIPGHYFIYQLGDGGAYTASARPNDYAEYNGTDSTKSNNRINVTSGSTTTINLSAIRAGSISGTIIGVNWDGAQYAQDAPAPNVAMRFGRDQSIAYEGSTKYNFKNTTAWLRDANFPTTAGAETSATTDSNGQYTVNNLTPIIVYDDTSKASQFNNATVRTDIDGGVAPPFLPVIVKGPLNNPKFLVSIRQGDGSYLDTLYPNLPRESYQLPIYTDGLSNAANQNQSVMLLERSVLGSVHGEILNPDGTPFPLAGGRVTASNNISGAHLFGIYISNDGKAHINVFDADYSVIDANGKNTYNLMRTCNYPVPNTHYKALFPNLSTQQTIVHFGTTGQGPSQPAYALMPVTGKEKALVNGSIVYRDVPTSDMDISAFPIEVYRRDAASGYNYWLEWSETVSVVDGSFQTSPHPTVMTSVWTGDALVTVQPGQDHVVNLTVNPSTDSFASKYMKIPTQNSGWSFDWTKSSPPGPTLGFDGTKFVPCGYCNEPIALIRVGTTGKLYGRVTDSNGVPIIGASVQLTRSGRSSAPYPTLTYTTVANACPACGSNDFQYVFDQAEFLESSGFNLIFKVTATGFNTAIENKEGYDGITKELDFIMLPPNAGNSAGNSPGGGSW